MRVRVGNRIYALTPEQKQLKRQYKLEQYNNDNEIPSFEDAISLMSYEIDKEAENYAYEFTRVEADDDDVQQWLAQQDITPDTADMDLDQLIEGHRETVSELLSLAEGRERVLEEMQGLYDEAVYRVEHELDGADCWRAVTLPATVDPQTHEGLGVYWAYDEHAAEAHWGELGKQPVTYRARIDTRYINKSGTISANVDPSTGETEKEVQFFPGAPIYVYDVTIFNKSALPVATIEINDWRTT